MKLSRSETTRDLQGLRIHLSQGFMTFIERILQKESRLLKQQFPHVF